MGIFDWLGRSIKKATKHDRTITLTVDAETIYKRMAMYTASTLIENAISVCDFNVYKKGERVKDEDYFRLNVAPNKNDNAAAFWRKVVKKMMADRAGALVFEHNGELHLAESFFIEEDALNGNVYKGIVLEDGTEYPKDIPSMLAYHFRMDNTDLGNLISTICADEGKWLESAAQAFKISNGQKFKLSVEGLSQGDEEEIEAEIKSMAESVRKYMSNEYGCYVEYDGEVLTPISNGSGKTADDTLKIKEDIFRTVAQAYKIPQSLMTGQVTSVKDVMKVFLTFAVNPVAKTIEKTLNKRSTYSYFRKGSYYKVSTQGIVHRDPIDMATDIQKLVGSAIMSPDEVREEFDMARLETEWSQGYYMTKNIATAESAADDIENPEEGGGTDEKDASNALYDEKARNKVTGRSI